jgi:hypothetical protein
MRLTAGLKRGQVAVVGWQAATPIEPTWLTRQLLRNKAKQARRARYERMYARRR